MWKSARSAAPRERLRTSISSRPGSKRGGELGAVGVERVEHAHRAAAHVVVGQAERVPHRRPDERERQHLDVPGLGQCPGHRPLALLRGGEAATGRGGGQHRRNGVEALQPQHLLDEVRGLGEVGPPRRRRWPRPDPARRRRSSARPGSRPGRGGARWPRAGRRRRRPGRAAPAASGRGRAGGAAPASVRPAAIVPAAVLDEQLRRALGGDRGQLRVDGPLEAPRRLAGQLVPAGGPGDDGRVEVGGLEQDVDLRPAPVAISVPAPPITPASPIGPESSVISRSSGSRVRSTSSSVVSRSPLRARRTTMPPASRAAS